MVTITHRNEDSDQPAAFNYTLEQQGLSALVASLQGSDRWRHRQFGMTMSGTAGGKAPLARKNASTLTSGATTATQFEVTVSTAASQTESSEEWFAAIAAQHNLAVGGATHDIQTRAAAVATRVQSHQAWWDAFWSRSHIVVSSSNSSSSEGSGVALLTQQYAICRYVQAIQARTWVPVKFNVSAERCLPSLSVSL